VLTRVAGDARAGFSGDGGPAVDAQLFIPGPYATDNPAVIYPSGIAVDRRLLRPVQTDGAMLL
jgi:hypothetical protein